MCHCHKNRPVAKQPAEAGRRNDVSVPRTTNRRENPHQKRFLPVANSLGDWRVCCSCGKEWRQCWYVVRPVCWCIVYRNHLRHWRPQRESAYSTVRVLSIWALINNKPKIAGDSIRTTGGQRASHQSPPIVDDTIEGANGKEDRVTLWRKALAGTPRQMARSNCPGQW